MLYTRKTFSFEHPVEEADVCLLGVPFDSTGIGHSTRYGPLFIRESLRNLVGHDIQTRANPFSSLKFSDLGDIEVVPGSWKLTSERIADTVKGMLSRNPASFPVIIGGEHLITLSVLQSMPQKNITVIHFDAHRDLMPDWMGEPYSHISWAHHISKDPRFKLVQIGCRVMDEEERPVLNKIKVKEDLKGITGPVYITIDLDVLDPSHAPEVGTPEPLGMSPEKLLEHLRNAFRLDVVGMDIVECASERVNTQTANLAAFIIKKALCYRMENENGKKGRG